MSQVRIINRLFLPMLLLIGLVVAIGCESSISMLGGFSWTLAKSTGGTAVRSTGGQDEESQTSEAWSDESSPPPPASDLVKDWEQPTFAIFFSGRQHGYMEPCGCTGLANQKGGLMRRHSALKVLEQRGWDLVKIDSGNQINRFGQQTTLKLAKTFQAICEIMDYDVVGLGQDDLKTPSYDLAQAMVEADGDFAKFTCANVVVEDPQLSKPFRVIEKSGKRIGVTMILGDEHREKLGVISGVKITPVAAELAKVVPQLIAEKCDLNILVAAASSEDCRALAKQFPIFNLLISNGCAGDPTLHPEVIDTGSGRTTSMVQVGVKGMYVGIIGYFENNGSATIKYERVPLDERFEDSEEIKRIFISYQEELKRWWLAGQFRDIKPQAHPSGHQFVGTAACADCHDDEYQIWLDGNSGDGGPHEHATKSLTDPNERSWVQRNFDPECVSCHMTGWNPQGFYPFESGFLDIEKDVTLYNNGCENCHGPGSAHIDAERNKKDDSVLLTKLREEMRLTVEEARTTACVQCHDLDNSPEYVKEGGFDKYWPEIEH